MAGRNARSGQLRGVSVAIAGAGLAGLVAARELARDGAQVRIFEARNRLGGRVWTIRDEPVAPNHAEAGGEFIDGSHQEIRALIGALNLELVHIIRGGFGLALLQGERVHVIRSQQTIWRSLQRALEPAAEAFRAAGSDWNSVAAAAIARLSVDELLRARRAPRDVRDTAVAMRGFFLADPNVLSALVAVEQSLEDSDPGHVPLYRIKGGNDRLVSALADSADIAIQTEHIVRRIERRRRSVRLAVEGPDGRIHQARADYFIATVPPPIVLEWQISPPLPEMQQRALAAVKYGPATKAFLTFTTPWWRDGHPSLAFGTNLPVGAIWDSAEDQRGAAILTLLAGGAASIQLRQLVVQEGLEGVVQRLRWMGNAIPAIAIRTVTWTNDPWARGGYAFFSPSFEPSWRVQLALGAGRMLFAGDHTSRKWQGYMNGAVESGQRVAQDVRTLEQMHRLTSRALRT